MICLSDSFYAGRKFTIAQIEELCSNHAHSVSNEWIQEIVVFLLQTEGLSKHMDSFTKIVSLLNVEEGPFYFPVPLQQANSDQANSLRFSELPRLYMFVPCIRLPYSHIFLCFLCVVQIYRDVHW